MNVGLRARASFAVLSLIAAVASLAIVVMKRADGALQQVDRARFQQATAQLADAVSYGVLAHSDALMGSTLDAFARNGDLVRVDVIADGAVLSSREGPAHASARSDETIEVRAPVRTRAAPPGDDGELAAFGVEAAAPRTVGEVAVVFSSAATAQIQRQTRRDIVLAAFGTGLLGLLGVGLLMTSVVRRVRTVAAAAARVRGGQMDVTVEVGGADELGQLGGDFNAMTRALLAQQQRLDDAAKALAERESLAAIGRATAVIAHELKNPLGIVLGAAQIVGNEKKPLEARVQAAGIVEEEVRRLALTLDDLLSWARPRAPAPKRVDVRTACEQAATRALHAGGPMHGRTVTVDGARDIAALVDEGQLQQALLNLLQNAGQAGALSVTLTVLTIDGGPALRVTDDGPGVPAAMRDQLFLPFATSKQRGTGLGLAASRRMMRDNGGELSFVDVETGTAFLITLRQAPLGTESP